MVFNDVSLYLGSDGQSGGGGEGGRALGARQGCLEGAMLLSHPELLRYSVLT